MDDAPELLDLLQDQKALLRRVLTRTEEFNLAGGITENTYRHNLDSPEPQQ
jgi:hypothetical protein